MNWIIGILLIILSGLGVTGNMAVSTIAGTEVPAGLVCQEDEVIGFGPPASWPYTLGEASRPYNGTLVLGCVHIDIIRAE